MVSSPIQSRADPVSQTPPPVMVFDRTTFGHNLYGQVLDRLYDAYDCGAPTVTCINRLWRWRRDLNPIQLSGSVA